MPARCGTILVGGASESVAAAVERRRPTRAERVRDVNGPRWRDEGQRPGGVVLGSVYRRRVPPGCAAPPLLRASRRRLEGLPGARGLRGPRPVPRQGRSHRASAPRPPPPGTLAEGGLRHQTQTAPPGTVRVHRTI